MQRRRDTAYRSGVSGLLYLLPAAKEYKIMRLLLTIIGAVVTVIGIVFLVQGLGILMGSFMTGQLPWAIVGAVLILVGIGLILYVNNRREAL